MMEQSLGKDWLLKWKGKWIYLQLLVKLLYAIGSSLFLVAILSFFFPIKLWLFLLLCLVFFASYILISGLWKISLQKIAFQVDAKFPELEYSSSLFLKSSATLGVLQRFQLQKIEGRLSALAFPLSDLRKALFKPLFFLVLAFLCCLVSRYLYTGHTYSLLNQNNYTKAKNGRPGFTPLPSTLTAVHVRIQAPAYTKLPDQITQDLSIKAAEGSTIIMHLQTNVAMKQLVLLFDGKQVLNARQQDSLNWEVQFKPEKGGFYQIQYDGKASSLYPITLIPDKPASIQILRPEPRTLIEVGYPKTATLEARLTDDYGIKEAVLVTTISSGKGESVNFKSKEMPLSSVAGAKVIPVKYKLDLTSMEMKPGDELYFYLRARDVAGQESRSDVYLVSLQDTTELMSMSGMVSGSDIAPEYFRSERQIIIDAEKLLEEQPKLSEKEAQNRSNNLGVDQKLLRLRYGQFLGEEAETEIGGDHDHDHEGPGEQHESGVPEDIEALKDQFTHHHDKAEDATFFTPEQKTQLKAVLTEMWNAELKLRTFQPQQALPYAYKALKLLKDLQQQSRTFVGKAQTKTSPLKTEKRLSGDLVDIINPKLQQRLPEIGQKSLDRKQLSLTFSYLSNLKAGASMDKKGLQLIADTEPYLIEAARQSPDQYLMALKAARLLEETKGKYDAEAVHSLLTAIQHLLPEQSYQPGAKYPTSQGNIYSSYFNLIQTK